LTSTTWASTRVPFDSSTPAHQGRQEVATLVGSNTAGWCWRPCLGRPALLHIHITLLLPECDTLSPLFGLLVGYLIL
jgi:hypothetical protein